MNDDATVRNLAVQYLGKGYLGWQYYADPESCTEQLFDLSSPGVIAIQKADKYTSQVTTGKNRTEYFNKLSANLKLSGGSPAFSGSVTATYSGDVLKTQTAQFATLLDVVRSYRVSLALAPNSLALAAKVKPEVQEAIDTMDCDDLFDRYGTHYTSGLDLGGRVEYSTYVDQSTQTSKSDLSTSVTFEYAKLAKGGAGGGASSKDENEEVSNNAKLTVIGGDPGLANSVKSVSGSPQDYHDAYTKWSTSIWPDHVSIANFASEGLAPIYTLATSVERRAELQTAWTRYMKDHTEGLLLTPDPTPAPAARTLRYGETFYLKYDNGTYLSAAEELIRSAAAAATSIVLPVPFVDKTEYYPTLRSVGRVKVRVTGGDLHAEVKSGDFVQFVTAESTLGQYTVLGVWSGDSCAYYYKSGHENQDWTIAKASAAEKYAPVAYGDRVFLVNRSFPSQRLCSAGAPLASKGLTLLTTKETKGAGWIMEPA